MEVTLSLYSLLQVTLKGLPRLLLGEPKTDGAIKLTIGCSFPRLVLGDVEKEEEAAAIGIG